MATATESLADDLKALQTLCGGCKNDFYNQPGNSTCGHCWSLPTAQVVTRYRICWWTRPSEPGAYVKVITLDCHHAPGRYAHAKELTPHVINRGVIELSEPLDARNQ